MTNIEIALEAYLTCALWTSPGMEEDGVEYLDAKCSVDDFAPEARERALKDVTALLADPIAQKYDASQVGHDLWLTRNGHGAGFWDRGWGADGDYLTKLAEKMKGVDCYIGDDGRVYFS